MNREVHIISYFSLPTDLAAETQTWPEFVSGEGYQVELKSDDGETVSMSLVEGEVDYLRVRGVGSGLLFDRALGRAVHVLANSSDNVMVNRIA